MRSIATRARFEFDYELSERFSDHRTAAHIGYLHAWQQVERTRLDSVGPEITDHIVLARRYFEHAMARGGHGDERLMGFSAAFA